MRRLVAFAAVLLWLTAVKAPPCAAYPEHVDELWRSPYGQKTLCSDFPESLVVDPTDGSVWVVEGANVRHISADGMALGRTEALYAPCALAVDPADGSCWVLESLSDRLLHFASDGTRLSATPGYSLECSLTPSPADGSEWVTGPDFVSHVDSTGRETWRAGWASFRVVVDPNDGSAWMSDGTAAVRVRADDSEMWRVPGIASRAPADEDPRDQSIWLADGSGLVTHVSSAGAVLAQLGGERAVLGVRVFPGDGSVWVSFSYDPTDVPWEDPASAPYVLHLDSAGTELWRYLIASLWFLNDSDGSVWLRTTSTIQFSAEGEMLHVAPSDKGLIMACDPADNSLWLVDMTWSSSLWDAAPILRHLGSDGRALWEERMPLVWVVAGSSGWVDPDDGSCWVREGDREADEFVHLSAEGVELERRRPAPASVTGVAAVDFSALDDSWWLGATTETGSILLHLAADGTELWRREWAGGVDAIDETNGSAWKVRNYFTYDARDMRVPTGARLYHLPADGSEPWESALLLYMFGPLAINAADSSVYVVANGVVPGGPTGRKVLRFSSVGEVIAEIPLDAQIHSLEDLAVLPSDASVYGASCESSGDAYHGQVFRMAADGSLMWVRDSFIRPEHIALDRANGSVWIADAGDPHGYGSLLLGFGSAVVHLSADGEELWRGGMFNAPGDLEVARWDGSVWVSDYCNGQLIHLRGVLSPFSDVPGDFWAFHEIRACMEAGIAFGYGEGHYQPSLTVTRDQMAVYIARGLAGGDANVPTGPPTASFPDVPPTHWAHRYVEYCHDQGVVQGYEDGYRPDEAVSRAQMAAYVARALAGGESNVPEDPDGMPFFPDVGTDHWACKHVEYCHDQGVVQGYPDGYHPDEVVNRAQMAVYMQRAFDLPM